MVPSPPVERVASAQTRMFAPFGASLLMLKTATGGAWAAYFWVEIFEAPQLSVTVRETLYVFALEYVWVAVTPTAFPPSPKAQLYASVCPASGSEEPPPSTVLI